MIVCVTFCLFAIGGALTLKNAHERALDPVVRANVEALAQCCENAPFCGCEDGVGKCCVNGYKSWSTQGWPWQTKESFRDCWCAKQEGYNPADCSCG